MTALTANQEAKLTRQKGLMARALEVSNNQFLDSHRKVNSSKYDFNKSLSPVTKPHHQRDPPLSSRLSHEKLAFENFQTQNQNHVIEAADPFSLNENMKILSSNKISVSSAIKCSSLIEDFPDIKKKQRLSSQSSNEGSLQTIQEDESPTKDTTFASTQHLRNGFFRTIKRQYPTVGLDDFGFGNGSIDSGRGESITSDGSLSLSQSEATANESGTEKSEEEMPFMSSMARKRLRDLRKVDPKKVDVATGLQWIRLELHEMREQDKALFLQLIKLHTTIKEIRTEMNFMEERDSDGSYDSINDAPSFWWPRCNSASVLPDFSSSDGAQLLSKRHNRPYLQRGFSFNHPPRPTRFSHQTTLSSIHSSFRSLSSSSCSTHSTKAC